MSFWDLLKASSTFWNCLTLFGGCSWCQSVSCTFPPALPSSLPPHPATPRRAAPASPAPPSLRKSRRVIPPFIQERAILLLATTLLLSGLCCSLPVRSVAKLLQELLSFDGDPIEVRQAQPSRLPDADVSPNLPSLPLHAAVARKTDLLQDLANLAEVDQPSPHPSVVGLRYGGQPDLVLNVHEVYEIAELPYGLFNPHEGLHGGVERPGIHRRPDVILVHLLDKP